jgi:signal transduction histidine kinase
MHPGRTALWSVALWLLASAAAADPRRVLLLHSFGPDYAPWGDMAASLRSELVKQSPEPIDLYEASVFSARVSAAEEEKPFADYLSVLFRERKLDLIIAAGTPAADLVQRHRASLAPTQPLLIFGHDVRRMPDDWLSANDAAVGLNADLTAYIDNILRVRPETNEIAIIIGDSPLERFWAAELRQEYRRYDGRVNFTWLNELPFDKILEKASSLPPRAAIQYFILSVDAAGAPYVQGRIAEKLRAVATVPIFGLGDYDFGRGMVGGPLLQTQAMGQQAAAAAVRLLRGEPPASIRPAPMQLGTPVYDWRELHRWRISEARLPPGSIVHFREPGVWEQYRWQIMLAAATLLVQSLLIAALFTQSQRRRSAEVEARRRMGDLALMNRRAAIGEMSASITHEIRQPLSAIVINSGVGLRWLAKEAPEAEETAAALKRIASDVSRANTVIESIRGMFKKDEDSRAVLDVNDVIREVLALIRIELDEHNVTLRVGLSEGMSRVQAHRIQLQQVILNLARNAIEAMTEANSHPRILKLGSAANDAGEFLVTIEDTGPGIDPAVLPRLFEPFVTTKSSGMGMGLSICRSIVETHGGHLAAAQAKPHGAIFEISLPLA